MLLHIIARGKIARSPEEQLLERYARRIVWPFRHTELPETGGRIPPPQTPCRTVLLDERGKAMPSEDFAALLGRWRDEGIRETRFLIGAADGHEEPARRSADLLLGFGAMTWPHLLARAMLAEQLWRATSILAGHPYHRSG
ncbi:23S rRNA (pseudouridine(1915)-N(3))-methyltransferase RlmH [Novosphingobium album (ex Liu et al. 2023)]|uniref:Ribosomal RNA large subunit methyltransferase H n=1 Tax=Novosphingobium album (ex Liu et al. 2023) TaxID=3031130 RepID=A0ABT5WP34_9SPHN|nr:23S rRNA (pseudouridine(1915)-N(3))-methyltransferase RlmH [Novosphingobium album (ex Liu et al. 2023)]MDE8651815.1 23S rRNA (pseudouridine(1915)-N(3))-methyltransferase RlmH [Novosphingobium album (ex Liu et al. 2023)]